MNATVRRAVPSPGRVEQPGPRTLQSLALVAEVVHGAGRIRLKPDPTYDGVGLFPELTSVAIFRLKAEATWLPALAGRGAV